MSSTPTSLTRRPARTVPVLVVAFLAILVGGAATWLLGTRLLDGTWPASATAAIETVAATRMDAVPVLVVAGLLALVGLVLLVSALIPGDPATRAVLADGTPGETVISTRDLARRVESRALQVDGVLGVDATVRGSRVEVDVRTPIDDTTAVQRRARAATDEALAQLRPVRTLRPDVRTRRTR